MSLRTKQGAGNHSSGLQCQGILWSQRAMLPQTQQQLPGCKAKTIPHIPEQTDNTRAGPVTISNSSHMILCNNWTPHSRAVSLSSTAVQLLYRVSVISLSISPRKIFFPYSLQSKNTVGQNHITKWKESVAETEQYSWTSNSCSNCILPHMIFQSLQFQP